MHRRDFLKTAGVTAGASVLPFLRFLPAEAASRKDTLVVVFGNSINSLDIHRKGTNRPSYQVTVNIYDRLVRFGVKTLPDGSMTYDSTKIVPEVAESWTIAEDGKSLTFKINPKAKFWDGSPVTAHDVKWSFDRAVSLGGFPAVQMKAGSMTKREQFVVVDDMTFRVDLPQPSKLTLPDLAVPVPFIINSKVVKKHATDNDPWATEYLHKNPAGSGAYKLTRWDPGQQFVYERNDAWALGPKPGVKRVIVREVPSASTRRALTERGDADFYMDVPAKDAKELKEGGKVKVSGAPIDNCLHVLGLNVKYKPFDNLKVRQAIAYAVPYKEILSTAAYGRGKAMFGGTSMTPSTIAWPQPFPYAEGSGLCRRLRDDAVVQPRPRRLGGTRSAADPGIARQGRHQGDARQDPGRQLAHRRARREAAADASGEFRRLAELPRLLFLLGLPAWAPVQLVQLQEPGDREAGRRDPAHGDERPEICAQREAHA